MKIPTHIFREYDIRGVADRDLLDDLAEALGRVLGGMLAGPRTTRIAVGRDCRLSSPRLFEALVRGLVTSGASVIDIGVGPTPLLYFAAHHLNTDGAIQITGSHNPGDENGFKIMRGKASFYGAEIQELRARIEQNDFPPEKAGSLETDDVGPAYVSAMTERFSFVRTSVPFVVDAGNGAGGPLALRVMHALGLRPDPLFCEMDGHFPNHHPDPSVVKNLETLIARVRSTHAEVGIAYDGDADRLGAIDAEGNVIWGDKLMILFSRAVLAKNPGATILGEVKCSQTLYDDIAQHGGKPIIWKTGHSLIKTKMKETGALLAGEMSGHIFFADRYFGFDDAIYASLRLLEIVADNPAGPDWIASLLSDVPKTFATPEIRVDCPDAIKFAIVSAVTKRYQDRGFAVLDVDGARITFPSDGNAPTWGLIRASNTGPILVMRVEAGTESEVARIQTELEAAVGEERRRLGG